MLPTLRLLSFRTIIRKSSHTETTEQKAKDPVPVRLSIPDDGMHGSVKVLEWYKKEGEAVKEGEDLCEIETPDFSYDFRSPISGYMAKVIIKHGPAETGQTIGYLVEKEEDIRPVLEHLAKETLEKKLKDLEFESEAHKVKRADLDTDEISAWLATLDGDLSQYAAALRDDGFDSIEAIRTIKEEDLRELGMKKGHVRILISAVEKLNQQPH